MTDEASWYIQIGLGFAEHGVVQHGAGEYVRDDIHTNTLEGCFSIFKRGMKGIYQHCGRQHLHRYVAEFEFRHNHRIANEVNDTERAALILKAAEGRRLTYRRPVACRMGECLISAGHETGSPDSILRSAQITCGSDVVLDSQTKRVELLKPTGLYLSLASPAPRVEAGGEREPGEGWGVRARF
jgi:hypothetical protein